MIGNSNLIKGEPTMDLPNARPDFRREFTAHDGPNRAAVDIVGGETLEGSGFENEPPEPEFQFDWTPLKHQSEGGLQ
jgi:hypothetical protein